MNLQPLYEMQDALDEKIVKEKGLEGRDLLPEKILALQVELGELANEWRGFKFWSENQKSRNEVYTSTTIKKGDAEYFLCTMCGREYNLFEMEAMEYRCDIDGNLLTGMKKKNPLLEEYVDCLHFILSIGNDLNCNDMNPYLVKVGEPIDEFGSVYFCITKMNVSNDNPGYKQFYYAELLSRFFGLGKSLGFDWEQIKTAYHAKNKINHERQQNGY